MSFTHPPANSHHPAAKSGNPQNPDIPPKNNGFLLMLLWGKNPGKMHEPFFFSKPLDSDDLSSHALSESKEDRAKHQIIPDMLYAVSLPPTHCILAAEIRDSPNLQTF